MDFYRVIEIHLSERAMSTGLAYQLRYRRWCEFIGAPWGAPGCEYQFLTATKEQAADFMALEMRRPSRPGRNGEMGRATSTINVTLASLHSVYERLIAHGLCKENPFAVERAKRFRRVTEKRPTQAVPFEKVFEMMERPSRHTEEGRRDRAILALLFGGGLRRSEVSKLRIRDARKSLTGIPFLRLVSPKGSGDCDQAIPQWSADALSEWLIERKKLGAKENDFVFPAMQGAGEKIHDATIYLLFKRYLGEVGLSTREFSPHSARATAITKMLSDGESYRDVQEFSRHKSVAMVELYDKRYLGIEKSPAKRLTY